LAWFQKMMYLHFTSDRGARRQGFFSEGLAAVVFIYDLPLLQGYTADTQTEKFFLLTCSFIIGIITTVCFITDKTLGGKKTHGEKNEDNGR